MQDLVVVKLEEGPDVRLFDPSAQEEGEIGSIRFADSEVITLRYTVTVCRSRWWGNESSETVWGFNTREFGCLPGIF